MPVSSANRTSGSLAYLSMITCRQSRVKLTADDQKQNQRPPGTLGRARPRLNSCTVRHRAPAQNSLTDDEALQEAKRRTPQVGGFTGSGHPGKLRHGVTW